MKNMIFGALCIVAILLLADLWNRAAVVHAQGASEVYVNLVPLIGRDGSGDIRPRGSQVVGFSCLVNSLGPVCYVASQ
jgi:hypothetical protein